MESESRKLLQRLKDTLAENIAGQARLDHIVSLIASSMRTSSPHSGLSSSCACVGRARCPR